MQEGLGSDDALDQYGGNGCHTQRARCRGGRVNFNDAYCRVVDEAHDSAQNLGEVEFQVHPSYISWSTSSNALHASQSSNEVRPIAENYNGACEVV